MNVIRGEGRVVQSQTPPHNLNHLLHKIRFFKLRFFLVASFAKISYTKKDGTRPCYEHGRSLTTNHLPAKGNLWLTQILPAHQKPLAAYKNHSSTIFSTVLTQHTLASIAIWRRCKRSAFSIR